MPDIQTIASILAAPQSTGSEFLTAEEQRRILAFQQIQKMAGATNMPIYSAGTGALKVATGALGGLMEGITERKAAAEQAANSALQNKFLESLINQNGGGSPTFGSVDPGTVPPPAPVTPPPSIGGGGPDIGGGGIAPPVDIPAPAPMLAPPIESAPMASVGPPAGSFGPVADSSQQDAILAAAQQQGITPGAGPEPFHHVADAPRIVPIPAPPPVDGQPAMAPAPGLPVPDPATSVSPMAPAVMPGDMDRGMLFNPATPNGLSEGATVLPNAAVKPVPIGPNGEVSNLAPSSPMANDPPPRPPADIPNTNDLGSLSAKYESGGNIASAHKDNIGWAYGKWQFNSKGNLPEFFARYPGYAKSFAGLTPGTEAFNERWKMIARNDPQGFEAAQREHATHELEKPGGPLESASQLGFKTDNRGVYEAVWSGTQQHGGIKKVLAAAAQTPGFANMAPEDQVKAFYDARMHYVQGLAARGVPGLEGQPARYRDELKDATSLARSGAIDPNARAIPTASHQPASASPAQSGPSPQVLANALQNPQQAHTGMSRESLAMALKLMNDPRTPKAMQSAITAQVMQQLTPQKPIEVNGRLVDPRTFNVIKDFSDPKTAVVGNTVVDVRTGKPIYEGPVDPKTATVGDTVVDTRTGRPIFQGRPKPNIEYMKTDDGRIVGLDKNNLGPGIDATPPGTPDRTNPYAPAGKPPNNEQANAANYANRMVDANNIINSNVAAATSSTQRALSSLPGVSNFVVSESTQKVNQAKRDFMTAVLRRESGASISPTEFATADKQYFPQPGDSPEVIEQKRINRETTIKGVMGGAGPNYKPPETFKPDEKKDDGWTVVGNGIRIRERK